MSAQPKPIAAEIYEKSETEKPAESWYFLVLVPANSGPMVWACTTREEFVEKVKAVHADEEIEWLYCFYGQRLLFTSPSFQQQLLQLPDGTSVQLVPTTSTPEWVGDGQINRPD